MCRGGQPFNRKRGQSRERQASCAAGAVRSGSSCRVEAASPYRGDEGLEAPRSPDSWRPLPCLARRGCNSRWNHRGDSSEREKNVLVLGMRGIPGPFLKRIARRTGRRGTETAELALEGPGTVVRAAELLRPRPRRPAARGHDLRGPLAHPRPSGRRRARASMVAALQPIRLPAYTRARPIQRSVGVPRGGRPSVAPRPLAVRRWFIALIARPRPRSA